jgi:hypothetical protein
VDRDFGVAVAVFSEDAAEEMAGGWSDVSDAEFAFLALGGAADRLESGLVLFEECARFAEKGGTGIGEADPFSVAVEENGPEVVFHFLDGATERGLGDAQAGSGFGEAEFFGDGDEVSELPEVHVIAEKYENNRKSLFLLP